MAADRENTSSPMGIFERYLTVWVAASIVVGIVLGQLLPDQFQAIGNLTAYEINLPVTILIWLMIVPMLMKVDFGALHEVSRQWRGIGVTLGVNWLIKPFTMAALGWLFIGFLFRPLLPEAQIESYIAGLILLGAAPCTAMVFVWSHLTKGDANFTLTQVALNDTIMIFAFAPIVALLLGISAITIPWETLTISVVAFIVIPVIVGQVIRNRLMTGGIDRFNAFDAKLKPLSMIALLATLVLLFAFQGQQIIAQPMIIALLAVPIILQTYFIAAIAYVANKILGVEHRIAAPSAMIGASNFFELAVATAIGLFGFSSGAALATVVGVLVEVPVMLSLVAIANRSRDWFAHAPTKPN
ncbi:ACR3 family arsenite efflux transporter [Thalassospira sp. FZY0004]|nr:MULTISPECIES: ACR3 family arsenite efflux transporter [Thalassospira]MDG4720606.1 ACR3 family arsenite efflux transporter [Thalassospira sp. FZY0004]